MALPTTGDLLFSAIRTEYGGPTTFSSYYRGGSYVPQNNGNGGIASSGILYMSSFRGGYASPRITLRNQVLDVSEPSNSGVIVQFGNAGKLRTGNTYAQATGSVSTAESTADEWMEPELDTWATEYEIRASSWNGPITNSLNGVAGAVALGTWTVMGPAGVNGGQGYRSFQLVNTTPGTSVYGWIVLQIRSRTYGTILAEATYNFGATATVPSVSVANYSVGGYRTGTAGTVTASHSILNNGTYTITDGLSNTTGTWLTAGSASEVEVLFHVNTANTAGATLSGTFDTWMNLGTTRTVSLSRNTNGSSSAGLYASFRRASDGVVIGTGNFTLEIERSSA